ncbi:MAG: hypothetical protein JWN04_4759, partial [Myxococcaceae bacterium]|nr:hypothetical protein [Myxococcaceae bacterium]
STHEEPPLRVRTAVLAAAEAHVRGEGESTVEIARVASLDERRARAPKPSPHALDGQGKGHVLRAPWLLSTFGVAAAVALLVLGKNIESPRSELDRAQEAPTSETASNNAPGAPPPMAAAPAPAQGAASPEFAKKSGVEAKLASPAKPAPSRVRAPASGFAEPPASWSRGGKVEKRASRRGAPSGSHAEAQRDDWGEEREQVREQDKGAIAAPRSAEPMASQPTKEAASTGGAGATLGRSYGAAPPAPAAAAPSRRAADSADSTASPLSEAEEAPLSHDELVQRARKQLAAGSWAPAIESYRELLRRFPDDKQAASWRKQLALARAQERREGAH